MQTNQISNIEAVHVAAKFLDTLQVAEDRLWVADEDEVASLLGTALQSVVAMLDEVKSKLPHSRSERAAVARDFLASQREQPFSFQQNLGFERTTVRDGQTTGIRVPPSDFTTAMDRAREQILDQARLGGFGDHSTEESVMQQIQILEIAIDDIRETITSVDATDLREIARTALTFLRFAAAAARAAARAAVESALGNDIAARRALSDATTELRVRRTDRFEELGEDESIQTHGDTRRRQLHSSARGYSRVRVLWPSLRRSVFPAALRSARRLAPSAAEAARARPAMAYAVAAACMLTAPVWAGLVGLACVLVLPVMAVDEVLQAVALQSRAPTGSCAT